MKSYINALTSLLVALAATSAFASPWWSLQESLVFPSGDGRQIRADVLTVDLKAANVRIVSVPFEGGAGVSSSEMSLRAFAAALAASHPRYRSKEWIALNGAFSSFRADVPLGLLVVDGKVYSTLSREKAKPGWASVGIEFGQLRWSGILCQLKSTKAWDIVAAAIYQPGLCQQALQGGPVTVASDSIVAVALNEPRMEKAYKRTMVCLTHENTMRLIVVTQEAHLLPLAQWSSRAVSAGGLGCRVALNLSGDTSSGMVIRSPANAAPRYLGEGSFPIPSALVVEARLPSP